MIIWTWKLNDDDGFCLGIPSYVVVCCGCLKKRRKREAKERERRGNVIWLQSAILSPEQLTQLDIAKRKTVRTSYKYKLRIHVDVKIFLPKSFPLKFQRIRNDGKSISVDLWLYCTYILYIHMYNKNYLSFIRPMENCEFSFGLWIFLDNDWRCACVILINTWKLRTLVLPPSQTDLFRR